MTASTHAIPIDRTAAETREAITRLLTARRGGTTRAELCGVLDIERKDCLDALRVLMVNGVVDRHDAGRTRKPRYTLAGESLLRPLDDLCGDRLAKHNARAAKVLAALTPGVLRSKRFLAAAAEVENPDRLEQVLRRMIHDGQIERVGSACRTRYRLPVVIRFAWAPVERKQ